MATNSFLGFSEDGTQLFEMKSKMARQVGDDASDSVKSTIRETLGVPASAEGLTPANNLSDVASAATSRTNLDVMAIGDITDRANSKAPSNGLILDGANDYLSFGNASLLDIGADEDFSIAGVSYFATNPSGYEVLYSKRSSGDGYNVQINPSGRLFAYIDAANGSNNSPDDGESLAGKLFHWVVTFDRSGNLTRYVDGSQYGAAVDISSQNGSLSNTASGLLGYVSGGSSYFSGQIRGFQFFNKALSASEVARLAATGAPDTADQWGDGSTSGCVLALLPTPGSIEASGKWLDSSSNQINGTVNGSPAPLFTEPQIAGTWSPGLTFGGGNESMSITGTVGNWRRVGKLCHFSCRFVVNDKGTSEGGTNLTGLPFTSKNNGSSYYATEVMQVGASGMSSLNSACYARINQNATTAILFHLASDGSGDAELQHSNFTNGAVIRISGTYEIE